MLCDKGEQVGYYYGINATTFVVERVARRPGGIMSIVRDSEELTHFMSAGKSGALECAEIFGLRDITFIPEGMHGTSTERIVIETLMKKAEIYKRPG